MRLEFDEAGYVCTVVFGCQTGKCTEYDGAIPKEPEEYASYADWADRAQVQAYYLDEMGNLSYDSARAAALPKEDDVVPYTREQSEKMGLAPLAHTHVRADITDFEGTTEDITDIVCDVSGKLQIGKTVVLWGNFSMAAIGNNSNSGRNCAIDLTSAGYTETPTIVATPSATTSASSPYGLMAYVSRCTPTEATIRLTSNYTNASLSGGVCWMAIGIAE